MTIPDAIDRLRSLPGVRLDEMESAWRVYMRIAGGYEVEVVVPRSVLEWFADIHDGDRRKVWSDWMDYEGYDRSLSREHLEEDMATDLVWFTGMLQSVDGFRVHSHRKFLWFKRAEAEVKVNEQWQSLELCNR